MSFNAVIKFLLNTTRKAAMNEAFGVMVFLQIMVTANLINVKLPPNAHSLFETLTQAATFDILYTDDWFPKVFGFKDLKPYNTQFEDNNLET
jgi:hypothetical protein